ncbi:MAG TPA: efflux RND transporter periplasmic adaptor subunit [Chthoniobacterales bacterium]
MFRRAFHAGFALLLLGCAPHPGAEHPEDHEAEPVAKVVVAVASRKRIAETCTAFGSVTAEPGSTHTVTRAFETRVRHVLVAPGEPVKRGQPLVEVDASAATLLQLHQAENAARMAHRDLDQTRRRFDLKLATVQELGAAEKGATDADLQLASLRDEGVHPSEQAIADVDGLVARIGVQDGQLAPAGTAIVEVASGDDLQVRLGVEPGAAGRVAPGEKVALGPSDDPAAATWEGTVKLVSGQVNATTRLVDVYVALPQPGSLLLNAYVQGNIEVAAHEGVVVPRRAVFEDQGEPVLFVVREGKAQRIPVHLGLQNDDEIELTDGTIRSGDAVVVQGHRELTDGMRVEAATGDESR